MKPSREDAALFFKPMWRLQFHVNRERQILPNIKSVEAYAALSMSDGERLTGTLIPFWGL